MHIGYIGLGKMGFGQVSLLKEKGHQVTVWNRSKESVEKAVGLGATQAADFAEMVTMLRSSEGSKPIVIWIMLPHAVVPETVDQLTPFLSKGDIVIDGGNSNFNQTMMVAQKLAQHDIEFLDCGTSGGPHGARHGACLMIGGKKEVYESLEPLFKDLASPGAYTYFGTNGAGHFVKMVHNGIEYGMMQAIGEGFEVLKRSEFNLNLLDVAKLYNKKSVIESRLIGWLEKAFEQNGQDLKGISGEVSHSGEGLWTVEAAMREGVAVPIIEGSLQFRNESKGNPSYTGQVVSALRNQFGGHNVSE